MRCTRGLSGATQFGLDQCLPYQCGEARVCVMFVRFLGAKALRRDDDFAAVGPAPAGETLQAYECAFGESAPTWVEAQLHGTCHFVDMLPARTAGTNAAYADGVIGYR